jgi:hypothetical protein
MAYSRPLLKPAPSLLFSASPDLTHAHVLSLSLSVCVSSQNRTTSTEGTPTPTDALLLNLRLGITPGAYETSTFTDDPIYEGMLRRGVARTFDVDEAYVFVVGPHRRRLARVLLQQGDGGGGYFASQQLAVTVGVITASREAAVAGSGHSSQHHSTRAIQLM